MSCIGQILNLFMAPSGAISIFTSSFEGFPLKLLPSGIVGIGKVKVVGLRAAPENISSYKGRAEH